MLKKLFAYILIGSFVFQFLGTMGVFAWFSLNRTYITQELCENRFRPELSCMGQCVLMKKLKKLDGEEGESKQNDSRPVKVEWLAMLPAYSRPEWTSALSVPRTKHTGYNINYTFSFTQIPFVPPPVCPS